MDTRDIYISYPRSADAEARASLNSGETPMPMAPSVELPNGRHWIPQQYLTYEQTEETLSTILSDIESVSDTLLFSGRDENGLYLQVGTLGPDNYKRKHDSKKRRLVYGRKWRIEAYAPTSEVIQTAFLAVKKACEHDVRELFTITDGTTGRTGTPFSTHIDLPLIANFPELVMHDETAEAGRRIAERLAGIRFDRRMFVVEDKLVRKDGSLIIDLRLDDAATPSARQGLTDVSVTLVLQRLDTAALLHELMDALVRRSDRLVDEHFLYRGVARFSRTLSPHRIASLSVHTRRLAQQDEQFANVRDQLNYETDARRAPVLGNDRLAHKNRQMISRETDLDGHMPIEKQWRQKCSA